MVDLVTIYDDPYAYKLFSSENLSGVKLAIHFYPHNKKWDYIASYNTVRDCWVGKGANVVMYDGLYAAMMYTIYDSCCMYV